MMQSSGSFFAYRSFLKALQGVGTLPLAEHLVRPADAAAPQGEPPAAAPLPTLPLCR
jgi:hypothetical protein